MKTDRRIHVMQVTFGMGIGGMERMIMELCRHVDPARFRLSICCISHRGPLADEMEAEGVKVIYCADQSRRGKYLRGMELARIFQENQVDLLHTHHMPAFIDSTIGARLAKVPILINTDHCKKYPLPRHWQVLEKTASLFADTIVAVSEHTRQDLIRYQKIAPKKLQVIYNGMDIKLTRKETPAQIREEFGFTPDDVIVGTVGRLEAQKGLALLVDAIPSVVRRVPTAKFLIVGGGSEQQQLLERAERLGVRDRLVITGWRRDAIDLMQVFECFAQTSVFEGMPMALIEAMALSKPIVATAVGGVAEVVEHGVTGELVRSRDAQAVADAIAKVVADRTVARRTGAAGRARFEERFTARAMVTQYERLYDHYLAQKDIRRN